MSKKFFSMIFESCRLLRAISHRVLNLKSVKNLKLAKKKSPSSWQLITFGWLI
jgi:hypothetical protein